MLVNVTARHCTVADSIRRRAVDRLRRMVRFEPRVDAVDVIFEHDHGLHAVEVRAFVSGSATVIAHAAAADLRAALDQALSRLGRQLKRQRERSRDHSGVRIPVALESLMKGVEAR